MASLALLYSILCIQFMLLHFPTSYASPSCHPHESSALLRFKSSFSIDYDYGSDAAAYCHEIGKSSAKTRTWKNGTDCCSWDGITCDTMSGHVIDLDLSCSQLQGNFHPNSTLFFLTHLKKLNLAFNDFKNSFIPSGISRLGSLTHLNLSYSEFAGKVPSEISLLSELVSLDLSKFLSLDFYIFSYDGLEVEASTWKRLMQNMTDLKELILDDVDLSSITPTHLSLLVNLSSSLVTLRLSDVGLEGNFASEILCLPKLQELDLSYNFDLPGQLPKSNCSSSLKVLDLSACILEGSIVILSNFTQLTSVDLSRNNFNGQIPSSLSNLQHLTSLHLYENNFNGQIPSSLSSLRHLTSLELSSNKFSGQIPSSLSSLQHLTSLHLSGNEFSGQISSSLSSLQHLTSLDLSRNEFSGQIPSSLSSLQHLTSLDLSRNEFSGQIPSSLASLQYLILLDLSGNNFSGQIPDEFIQLSKLEYLALGENSLGGQLPSSLLHLPQLKKLNCSFNKLEGPLPDKITGLPNLLYLCLNNNDFTGKIPSWISLPSLQQLDLGNNQFTGIGAFLNLVNLSSLTLSSNNISGSIEFHHFSKLQNLNHLDISNNNFLSIDLSANVNYSFPQLIELHMSSCNITTLPKFFGQLPRLQYLDLSNANLNGEVPKSLLEVGNDSLQYLNLSQNLLTSVERFSSSSVQFLDLSSNLLSGEILSLICRATSLDTLNLSSNNLTGSIPQCTETLSYLSVLDLRMNKFSGVLPDHFSRLKFLEVLNLNGNQFEGPLPQSLAHCQDLSVLDVGNNMINDTFPNWLEPLPQLSVLILRANKFHGFIKSFNTRHPFPKLTIFDVSNNNFSGPLPKKYIENLEAMRNATKEVYRMSQYMKGGHGYYDVSVELTMKGTDVLMKKVFKALATIDLSRNMFEGEIPEVIGELHGLIALNLSYNRLSGPIPQSMGRMSDLESLDLSSNKLTGGIPTELTNLNFLSHLNLSQNKLVGMIPEGKQFNTFQNDSYAGNMGLCGFPLTKKCKKDPQEQPPSSQTSNHGQLLGFGWQPVVVGYGCGMVFGVMLGWCVFKTGKPEWIVRIVEGEPNPRVRRTRRRTTR